MGRGGFLLLFGAGRAALLTGASPCGALGYLHKAEAVYRGVQAVRAVQCIESARGELRARSVMASSFETAIRSKTSGAKRFR
jgi:hypothetical protein